MFFRCGCNRRGLGARRSSIGSCDQEGSSYGSRSTKPWNETALVVRKTNQLKKFSFQLLLLLSPETRDSKFALPNDHFLGVDHTNYDQIAKISPKKFCSSCDTEHTS